MKNNTLHLTDQNFKEEVLNSDLPVMVDYWTSWCFPCRIVGPIIEELAEEFSSKLKVGKLNVDENPQTAASFGIMSIPTIIIFKDGKQVKVMVGAQSKDYFKQQINQILEGK
ncbi:thioredoxin [Candidatus Microgenomates bacterium]|nr:thioredoxin [Candidatus Microgenomates bacterium]